MVRRYLSFGAGVNSTALGLYLLEKGIEFEWVFADTGCEYPETYDYIKYLQEKLNIKITIVRPVVDGIDNLYDYCVKYRVIPLRIWRWCTDKFKVRPLREYFKSPGVVYMGIDAGEAYRAKPVDIGGMVYEYPLIEEGIDRKGCIEIIRSWGLEVPPKSGCFICPFQRRAQWLDLYRVHPDLFQKAVYLEKIVNERLRQENRSPIYFREVPLEDLINIKQLELFEFE